MQVLEFLLKVFRILMGAEIDCYDGPVPRLHNYVELKTSKLIETPKDQFNWERCALDVRCRFLLFLPVFTVASLYTRLRAPTGKQVQAAALLGAVVHCGRAVGRSGLQDANGSTAARREAGDAAHTGDDLQMGKDTLLLRTTHEAHFSRFPTHELLFSHLRRTETCASPLRTASSSS